MFWKKKKNEPPEQETFDIEFEEGPRYYFRVTTPNHRPVVFQAGERSYQVVDISAGGIGLKGPGLTSGQRLAGLLHLPDEDPLPMILVLRNVLANGHAGSQITKIKEQDRERIHQYVLVRQKEDLEEQRRLEESSRGPTQG